MMFSHRIFCGLPPAALVVALSSIALPAAAQEAACAPVVTTEVAPPPLPDYDQPPVPGPGYIWAPGYWAWDGDEGGYYWVPGAWAEPPREGLLWTPGYWAWIGGQYLFHEGYWGPRVGFYGGVAYGYGYSGEGYQGGRWDHGTFYYNQSVNNLSGTAVRNVYNDKVVVNGPQNRVSFNGGRDGTTARPTPEDKDYARQSHFAPTRPQQQQAEISSKDPKLFEKSNQGKPPIAATSKLGDFKAPGVTPASGAANAPLPAGEGKPGLETRRPPLGANPPLNQGAPKPALQGAPPVEVSKPLATQPHPNLPPPEAKKPEEALRPPQAMRPPPQLAPQVHEPGARPPMNVAGPAVGHPPGKPQEKRKPEGKKPEDK